uniref:Brix domain-containing protein n=1 Tax=Angiostrongylus cantonensis TaxID=6313 RepID=A0A0K0DEY0_ANGCA
MPRTRRKGRAAKAARRGRVGDVQERAIKQIRTACAAKTAEYEKARQPHSFVIHRGSVGKYVKSLVKDIRQILKRNNIKDFVVHGGVLGVTNMIVLTASEISIQLRMMRFNQGPTLTFRVHEYSLARHVLSTQKRPSVHQKLFEKPPLIILNGFNQLDLRSVKRCLLVNYWEEDDSIDIRHYAIRVVASAINKSVRKLILAGKSSSKELPDLSKYKDISDYLLNPGHLSDSEYEGEEQEVILPQSLSAKTGTAKGEKSHIRLMEIGPRLKLELLKVEDGIDEGEVLYNKNVQKTGPELVALKKEAPKKKKLKKRMEQENERRVIRRLEKAKEAKKLEEQELKAYKEKAARKQAAAIGQTEDIENCKEKDREIALIRAKYVHLMLW